MSEHAIREATPADIGRVADIKVRSWADTYGPLLAAAVLEPFLDEAEQRRYVVESMAKPGALLLVAERPADGVFGFALTYLDADPEPWLESLHVLRPFRGSGGGTALMRAMAARVLAAGHDTLRLGVVSGNTAAERYYERLGAIHTGREPVDWAEGVWHEVYRWPDVSLLTRV